MKKIVFGLVLILFGIACLLIRTELFHNDFWTVWAIVSPFAGVGVSLWGLFEKENEADSSEN